MRRSCLVMGAALLLLACVGIARQWHAVAEPSRAGESRGTGAAASPGTDENTSKPPGDIIAEDRIEAIIARLETESLQESLDNLDSVRDYYYPGFHSCDGVHHTLSRCSDNPQQPPLRQGIRGLEVAFQR